MAVTVTVGLFALQRAYPSGTYAKVLTCETHTEPDGATTRCEGTWLVDDVEHRGPILGVSASQVGETLPVRVEGDHVRATGEHTNAWWSLLAVLLAVALLLELAVAVHSSVHSLVRSRAGS